MCSSIFAMMMFGLIFLSLCRYSFVLMFGVRRVGVAGWAGGGRRPNSGSGTGTEELVVSTHRKSMFVLAFLFRSLWQKAEEGEGEMVLCVFSSIKTKRNPVVKIST